MTTAESVVEHHWRSLTSGDLSALMADYTEESTMVSNMGTFSGNGIERLYDDLMTDIAAEDATMTRRQQTVEEPFAYLVWEADAPERDYGFAAETLYVPEESIRFQSFGVEIADKD